MSVSGSTYFVWVLAFELVHLKGLRSAHDVSGLHDAVVGAEFAFRLRVKQRHVFKGASAHKNARVTRDGATFRLDGVDGKADVVAFVLQGKLGSLSRLFLREGEHWDVIGVDLACYLSLRFGIGRTSYNLS